jgi:hypothetical protein
LRCGPEGLSQWRLLRRHWDADEERVCYADPQGRECQRVVRMVRAAGLGRLGGERCTGERERIEGG